MAPTKQLIKNVYMALIGVLSLIWLAQGILLFHAPLPTLLLVEFSLVGAASVGALIGWLILRAIYPELRSVSTTVAAKPAAPIAPLQTAYVEYELGTNDILAFTLYHHEYSPRWAPSRKVFRPTVLVAGGVLLLVAIWMTLAPAEDVRLLGLLLGVLSLLMLIYGLLMPYVLRRALRLAVAREYRDTPSRLVGKHKVSIGAEAVVDVGEAGSSTTLWGAVEYLASTDKYLFMSVRGAGPYIVPRRAFSTEEEFGRFLDAAKAFHSAAATGSSA